MEIFLACFSKGGVGSNSFLIVSPPLLHSLPILPQTNVFSLADLWLWSRGVICERLCQHHWLPIHVTVYRHIPGRQTAKKEREQRWRWEGRTERWMKGGDTSLEEEEKKWGRATGRGGNHSIVSAEGKRYEYSNFTLLIRDGCLFLWGKHCLCLFPAWLFAWCILQLHIQWWEKDDVLAGWQWGLRGAEAGTVSFIQCKDQRPRFFTPN